MSGKYRIDARLGAGGMAEVFAATTLGADGFERRVALKRVLPGYSNNPQFANMFIAEAQISARLTHPNVVSVLDFDRDDEQRLFLVMELVDGQDLDKLATTGVLPFSVVVYVIVEVLRGLGYAHSVPTADGGRGVIHRDVSPHNVLLSSEGAVKVADFGMAKAREASRTTTLGLVKGKPAYMSPEQANGQALDRRSDLFAVGIMLWELLVGQRLFLADELLATIAAVLFGQIPRPRQLRPDLPKDLERVVMRMLAREPRERYQTAEEAVADLLATRTSASQGREALAAILKKRFASPVLESRWLTIPAIRIPQTPRVPYRSRWIVGLGLGGVAFSTVLIRASTSRSIDSPGPDSIQHSDATTGHEPLSTRDAAIGVSDASVDGVRRFFVDPKNLPNCTAYVTELEWRQMCPTDTEYMRGGEADELNEIREEFSGLRPVSEPTVSDGSCMNRLLAVTEFSICKKGKSPLANSPAMEPQALSPGCDEYVGVLDRKSKCQLLDARTRDNYSIEALEARRVLTTYHWQGMEVGCAEMRGVEIRNHPGCFGHE